MFRSAKQRRWRCVNLVRWKNRKLKQKISFKLRRRFFFNRCFDFFRLKSRVVLLPINRCRLAFHKVYKFLNYQLTIYTYKVIISILLIFDLLIFEFSNSDRLFTYMTFFSIFFIGFGGISVLFFEFINECEKADLQLKIKKRILELRAERNFCINIQNWIHIKIRGVHGKNVVSRWRKTFLKNPRVNYRRNK